MADKQIGDLPLAPQVNDTTLLAVEQGGAAHKMTGAQFKEFAKDAVRNYVEPAKQAAIDASKSAADAQSSATDAQKNMAASVEAKNEAAQILQDVEQLKIGIEANASAAAQSAEDAEASAVAAMASQKIVDQAEVRIRQNLQDAQDAQQGAEDARDAAAASEAAAKVSEDAAATSADTAQQYSGNPPIIRNGNWWIWDAQYQQYQNTGRRAVLGFDKVYESVAEMNEDKSNPEMTTAIISSNVDDPDNAKLYIYNGSKWMFLSDLSGFTGVGIRSIKHTSGDHSPGTTDIYTIELTDNTSTTFMVYNGQNGERGAQGPQGATGAAGPQGPQGIQGETGATGPQGPMGETGPVGPAGPPGIQGPAGPQGISGVAVATSGTYAFNVDENGHLILYYTGDTVPDFFVDENGHLIANLS